MHDGWGPFLMEAIESGKDMLLAAFEGVFEMAGMAASGIKDKAAGVVGAIASAPGNAARAVTLSASSMIDKIRGNDGPSQQQSMGVESFMPAIEPSLAVSQMASASIDLDAVRGYDNFDHGVSAYAIAPRSQGASLGA